MKKIVFLSEVFPYFEENKLIIEGGTEQRFFQLAKHLSGDFEVFCICPKPNENYPFEDEIMKKEFGIRVIRPCVLPKRKAISSVFF